MNSVSTAGTKGVPRAEREAQILDIAVDEIGRVGYAGLSIAEVATRAGVSKPLVYAYFQTKDGLYVACVERAAAVLGDAIEAAIAGPGSIGMAREVLSAVFHALAPRPQDWNVLFDRSHPADGPAADAVKRARHRIADQAARGVRAVLEAAGLDDPDDASALTDVWMGAVTALVNWWLRHPQESAEDMTARSHRLVAALAAVRT